jgi:integrative and conjugative element protein (TIGR02256 family)
MPHVTEVRVSMRAKEAMITEIRKDTSTETGGLLLGEYDGNVSAHVLVATGPGPNARKTKSTVDFDTRFLQAEQDRLMEESPHLRFLGDWHYHPKGNGKPSRKDICVLGRLTYDRDYQLGSLATILILYPGRFLNVRAFRLKKLGRTIEIAAYFEG